MIDARWEERGKKKRNDLTVPRVFFYEESYLRRWSGRPAQRKRVTPKNTRGTQAGRREKVVGTRDGIRKEEKGEKQTRGNCTRDGDLVFKSTGGRAPASPLLSLSHTHNPLRFA